MCGQTALVLGFMILVFGITCNGDIFSIIALTLLQGMCGMCFGFVISANCEVERNAIQLALGSFYPTLLLSGGIWPIEGMPFILKWEQTYLLTQLTNWFQTHVKTNPTCFFKQLLFLLLLQIYFSLFAIDTSDDSITMHADTRLGHYGTRSLFRFYFNIIVDRYIFGSHNARIEAKTWLKHLIWLVNLQFLFRLHLFRWFNSQFVSSLNFKITFSPIHILFVDKKNRKNK